MREIIIEDFINENFILYNKHSLRSRIHPSLEILDKQWKGEPLIDQRLVVWSEFGLGDEIMFSQLAHYLKNQQPKQLIFIVQHPLWISSNLIPILIS